MSETTTEPPSDPAKTFRFDDDDTQTFRTKVREALTKLADHEQARLRREARLNGAAWAVRGFAALAISIAGFLGVRALDLASTAAADHPRVDRHDEVIERMADEVGDIREDVAAIRGALGVDVRSRATAREE